jgi:radical SAM superfamily enzyme YgiQ (UPF0313 family)
MLVIVGGPQISAVPPSLAQIFLQRSYADYAVIGDGEETLVEVVKAGRGKTPIRGAVSLQAPLYEPRLSPRNLDFYPPPARDLISPAGRRHVFSKRRSDFGHINRITSSNMGDLEAATMMTSRGCLYDCAFCGTVKPRREHSVSRVLTELQQLAEQGVEYVVFFDDIFFSRSKQDLRRAEQIAQGMLKLNLLWEIEERADILAHQTVTTQFLQLLLDAGLRIINIGFEKPDNDSLALMKKGQHVDDAFKALAKLTAISQEEDPAVKFVVNGNFILGGPGETPDDCERLIDFALKLKGLGMSHASFSILEVYAGAPLWKTLGRGTSLEALQVHQAQTTSYYEDEESQLPLVRLKAFQSEAYQRFYASQPDLKREHNTYGSDQT